MNKNRYVILYIVFVAMFSIVSIRIFYLSYGLTPVAVDSAKNQYSRKLSIAERRGFIYDRNKDFFAGITNGYITVVDPSKFSFENDTFIPMLAESSNISQSDIMKKIILCKPFKLITDIDCTSSYAYSFTNYERYHPSNPAVHIIGYIDKSTSNGMTGLERVYNNFLKSNGGSTYMAYQADANQQIMGGLPVQVYDNMYDDKSGIVLTLDLNLQSEIENLISKSIKKGAVVIADGNSGEILMSASFPNYKINELSKYLESKNGELINRAFTPFTPGSLFKIVVACAALEYDENLANMIHDCNGIIQVGTKQFGCYQNISHGILDMTGAVANSCNTYFMTLAQKIGFERIYNMSKKMGIGSDDYLDMLNCGSGTLQKPIEGQRIAAAQLANMAIGQGETLVTPIEMTRILCTIVNKGIQPPLSIVKSLIKSENEIPVFHGKSKRIVSEKTADAVKNMLIEVINNGTGKRAKPSVEGIYGGKTATAQTGQYKNGKEIVHSWFSGFYSNGNNYIITILDEGNVEGSGTSTPLFAEICDIISNYNY